MAKKVTIEDIAVMTQKGFAGIDKRLDGIDQRLDRIVIRSLDNRVLRLEDKMRQLETAIGK